MSTDISKVVSTPDTVLTLLQNACFDCHSNNTNYPWYSNIQPVGWLMAYHIEDAKKDLNFSEFGSYSKRRQSSKLEGIATSINDNTMPLKSYKIIHKSAQLNADEKSILRKWTQSLKDSMMELEY